MSDGSVRSLNGEDGIDTYDGSFTFGAPSVLSIYSTTYSPSCRYTVQVHITIYYTVIDRVHTLRVHVCTVYALLYGVQCPGIMCII